MAFFISVGALVLRSVPSINFGIKEAASIGIIGGADGPTAIYVTKSLAPALLPAIAVAAYSYMALIPVIQPPIMKLMTRKKDRMIVMEQLRPVSKTEKILFPIIVTIIVALIIPDAVSLVGCLMLGNLMKESGVVERLTKMAQTSNLQHRTLFGCYSRCYCNSVKFPISTDNRYYRTWTYRILFLNSRRLVLG